MVFKKILDLFGANKVLVEKKGNEIFDSHNKNNSDEAIIRSLTSIRLLRTKIKELKEELGQITKYDFLDESQRAKINIDILAKIFVITKFISVIHSLAFSIVNNSKYKNTSKGSLLNLNFLTIMEAIESKKLDFNKQTKTQDQMDEIIRLIVKLSEIEKELEKIKILG